MAEYVLTEGNVSTVLDTLSPPKGAVPIAEFLAELREDDDLAGVWPEAAIEDQDVEAIRDAVTVKELRNLAAQRKIKGRSKLNEADLIQALIAAGHIFDISKDEQ